MVWFWTFFLYSFLGFLLEVAYAKLTHGRPERKGLLLLPLCPVYGLGACAILCLPQGILARPLLLFFFGGLAAATAEYLTALFYERLLGVAFWDYSAIPGNVQGKICIPFALAWGFLSLPLVNWLHPMLLPILRQIPSPVCYSTLLAATADALCSALQMKRSGTISCLAWYRH